LNILGGFTDNASVQTGLTKEVPSNLAQALVPHWTKT